MVPRLMGCWVALKAALGNCARATRVLVWLYLASARFPADAYRGLMALKLCCAYIQA